MDEMENPEYEEADRAWCITIEDGDYVAYLNNAAVADLLYLLDDLWEDLPYYDTIEFDTDRCKTLGLAEGKLDFCQVHLIKELDAGLPEFIHLRADCRPRRILGESPGDAPRWESPSTRLDLYLTPTEVRQAYLAIAEQAREPAADPIPRLGMLGPLHIRLVRP
ncbi:MAG TPA: hypothetical protein VFJ58_10105 [Armatimonadota bacterium]|nr:hypothetical protein [Armatimonadota bacterium]